jgi:hypothetical protein
MSTEDRTLQQNLKFYVLSFSFALFALSFALNCFAKEITILYTGETHAMLYPCNCPIEPDGGIARRAALIKQLRKDNTDSLFLDSGGFFAGGLMDEYTQNTQLDTQRTSVNLKAMELMQYDAVSIGDDEFNFGKEFLLENMTKTKVPFLSCNIQSEQFKPYLIKEIAGTKIGIIGVTTLYAQQKAGGLKFIEPKLAIKQVVQDLKSKGANIIILLSHLGESDDLKLIKEIEGIDILILGHSRSKEESSQKVGSTIILRPSWQGRRLGKLSLTITDKKITDYRLEELRLSDKISDDPEILSILPRCFSDTNCHKEGLVGKCEEPGSLRARCTFNEVAAVNLLIIMPKVCITCDPEGVINFLKKSFPGLVVSYLYYPDTKTNNLIRDFAIKGLPVYLLGKEAEKENGFDALKENLEIKGDYYMLKPRFGGFSYFLDRKKIKGKLDLFLSLYGKDTPELLRVTKKFNPTIHFLAVEQKDGFDAAKGVLEVEEHLRSVCVQKYYPESFWDYISCRGKNINSSWWEDCVEKLDTNKIKICSRSEEGKSLLKENISLNKELEIMFGPTYLLDNQEIFATKGVPTEEELKQILKD